MIDIKNGAIKLVRSDEFIRTDTNYHKISNKFLHSLAEIEVIALEKTFDWAINFLNSTHPNLGRVGKVCPFFSKSLQKNLLWMTAFTGTSPEEVATAAMVVKNSFSGLSPVNTQDSIFKCAMLVLPGLIHMRNSKEAFHLVQRNISEGIMIGEFYPSCNVGGIRNEEFRPFQSPFPMLVYRFMVATDFYFMLENKDKRLEVIQHAFKEGTAPAFLMDEYLKGLIRFENKDNT